MMAVITAEAGIQYALTSRFQLQPPWNTGSSAFADDDSRDSFFKQLYSPTRHCDLAAPFARVLPGTSYPSEHQRAEGMPGARCTRSLACEI
jgi:hypothetical protein